MAGESSIVVSNCVNGPQLRARRGLLRTPLPLSTKAPSGRSGCAHRTPETTRNMAIAERVGLLLVAVRESTHPIRGALGHLRRMV